MTEHMPPGYDVISETLQHKNPRALDYIPFETTLSDLLAQTPARPDLLIWWGLYAPLPPDLPYSPIPTALIVSDWHENLTMLKHYVSAFDYIFCDLPLHNILKQEGHTACAYWPAYALYPERTHLLSPAPERIWDVCYVGNLNFTLHPRREEYLSRLVKLSDRYQILIDTNQYGANLNLLLNQSKLVFNHSIRGELNLRVFEATACGAALLIEAENQEIGHYLPPGQGAILYNSANFEAQIDYYLQHEEERLKIAAYATQRIQQETATHQFAKLLQLLPEVFTHFGPERAFIKLSTVAQHTRHLRQNYPLFLIKNTQEKALTQLLSASPSDAHWSFETLNLVAACLSDAEFNPQVSINYPLKAEKIFGRLLSEFPAHPIIYTNAAWYCFFRQDFARALPYSQFARQLLHTEAFSAASLWEMVDGILPFGHNYFALQWQRLVAQIHQQRAQLADLIKLLHWNNLLLQAQILKTGQHHASAEVAYTEALELFPDFRLPGLELAELQAHHAPDQADQTFRDTLSHHWLNLHGHRLYLEFLLSRNHAEQACQWLAQISPIFEVIPTFRTQKHTFNVLQQLAAYLKETAANA